MTTFADLKNQTREILTAWGRWVVDSGRGGARGYPRHSAMVGAVQELAAGRSRRLTARGTPTPPAFWEAPTECAEGVAEIDAAVSSLPTDLRAIVFARYVVGKPWESIAQDARRTVIDARAAEGEAVAILTHAKHGGSNPFAT